MRIWSHLLKKSLIEKLNFCALKVPSKMTGSVLYTHLLHQSSKEMFFMKIPISILRRVDIQMKIHLDNISLTGGNFRAYFN